MLNKKSEEPTMTRSELIDSLKRDYPSMPISHIERIVCDTFEVIATTLINRGRAEFRGFGAFSTKERPGRTARNPRTGEPVQVASKVFPFYRCSRNLVASLNKWPTARGRS